MCVCGGVLYQFYGVIDFVDVFIIVVVVFGYVYLGDVGVDLVVVEVVYFELGEWVFVVIGVWIVFFDGYVVFVVLCSGFVVKYGILIVNLLGIVDVGYCGEIKVSLINIDNNSVYDVVVGDCIVQLIIMLVMCVMFILVDELLESVCGVGGFGFIGYQVGNILNEVGQVND